MAQVFPYNEEFSEMDHKSDIAPADPLEDLLQSVGCQHHYIKMKQANLKLESFARIKEELIDRWLSELGFKIAERSRVIQALALPAITNSIASIANNTARYFDNKEQVESNYYVYPEMKLSDFPATYRWASSRIANSGDSPEVWQSIKNEILAGSSALAITLALILTVAITYLLTNPCANSTMNTSICETVHIIPWALTITCSFIGIINTTNLYAHAVVIPPNERGISVLAAFPRVLQGRDAMSWTVVCLFSALTLPYI